MKGAGFQKAESKSQTMSSSLFIKNEEVSFAGSHDNPFDMSSGPAFNYGNIKVQGSGSPLRVQPKLQINQRGDKYEQEADAMADKVMRMSDKEISQKSFRTSDTNIQSKCAECEKEDEEKKVQRKESNNSSPSIAPPIVHDVLNSSSGKSLDNGMRSFMESRFKYDFSGVKIHDNTLASKSANSINALAYTSGENIVFSSSQYSPNTDTGKKLLAHELTHVLQQKNPLKDKCIQKFDSPEHVKIGDEAGQPTTGFIILDSHRRDLPNRTDPIEKWPAAIRELFNRNGATAEQKRFLQQGLTYGEVLALSGDFYETFEHLNQAPIREIYDLIPLIRGHASTKQLQEATGGRYMSLALSNQPHFSIGKGNNMETWRQRHIQAITVAKSGNANFAYAINAAADHFLTDRFAGGHLLTQRNSNRQGISSTARALASENELQSLSAKIDHDIDNQNGVEVKNLRGDSWIAFGDEMWDSKLNEDNRKFTIEATQASINDIKTAVSQGQNYPSPDETTVFNAEKIVPRTDTAISKQKHDESTRKKTFEAIQKQNSVYDILSSRYLTSDDLIRDWMGHIDNKGIQAQPLKEKVRMTNELLSDNIDDKDFDAFVRIYENSSEKERSEIRKVASSKGSTKVNVWLIAMPY